MDKSEVEALKAEIARRELAFAKRESEIRAANAIAAENAAKLQRTIEKLSDQMESLKYDLSRCLLQISEKDEQIKELTKALRESKARSNSRDPRIARREKSQQRSRSRSPKNRPAKTPKIQQESEPSQEQRTTIETMEITPPIPSTSQEGPTPSEEDDFTTVESKRAKRLRLQATQPKQEEATKQQTKTGPGFRAQPADTPTYSKANVKLPKKEKVPPIVIRNKQRYNAITGALKTAHIDFGHAVNMQEGIKIHPPTIDDYRKIQKFLDENKEQYHSYTLQEDKKLHIVLRKVPEVWHTDYVQELLRENGFHPAGAYRWYNRNGEPTSLVKVLLPKEEKEIFNLKHLNQMCIRVETQHSKTKDTQCHRCQKHGHAQTNCRANPKCVKCGEEHYTHTCTLPKTEPAKCANCGGAHPASYRGCPKHPRNLARPKETQVPAAIRTFKWGQQNVAALRNNTPRQQATPAQAQPNGNNAPTQQMEKFFEMMKTQFMSMFAQTAIQQNQPVNG